MVVEFLDEASIRAEKFFDSACKIAGTVSEPGLEKFVECRTNEAEQKENESHADGDIEKFGTKHYWEPPLRELQEIGYTEIRMRAFAAAEADVCAENNFSSKEEG